MSKTGRDARLDQIPILHVRGSHYEVGYTIGRQFRNMIDSLLESWGYYNEVITPAYYSQEGKEIYSKSLSLCTQKFPQLVNELQGIADGAKIPFYKLFMLHIDTLLCPSDAESTYVQKGTHQHGHPGCMSNQQGHTGCTSIMSNCDQVNSEDSILGHTEDAFSEFLNNVYIVSAEILGSHGELLEKFTTLSYPGHLPGYTMGFNHHGLVYSVNTIFLEKTLPQKTPRHFLARAMLKAKNFVEVVDILRDKETGISDGFSLNIHFAKQEGAPVFHNVEIGPIYDANGSELSVLTLTHGDFHVHCNKYLRLKITEAQGPAMTSSNHRHKTVGKHLKGNSLERVREILSDTSDEHYPVFCNGDKKSDFIKTVAVGIFNMSEKKWSIYINPPNKANPIAVIPLEF